MPVADARWFDVPVYYLTAKRTYSAAEHMALVLKSTGRATLIGEATGGGNHFGGTEEVGGGLEMFVPLGRTSDPATGRDWEGTGVAPDVAVPADQALDEALKRDHRRQLAVTPAKAGVHVCPNQVRRFGERDGRQPALA